MPLLKNIAKAVYSQVTHFVGAKTGRYYFEDFVRVYPDGRAYNRLGLHHTASSAERNNYLNHCKFYRFAAQFAEDKTVADIGCGSGYGCAILSGYGAKQIKACDISRKAVRYASNRFADIGEFSVQGITDLNLYRDEQFDLTISSEVLEHVKEYHVENLAVKELKRITRENGIIIIGTPNSEMLGDHGFSYEEFVALIGAHFDQYVIFEDALVPFGDNRILWEKRKQAGETGFVISQNIAVAETVVPPGATVEVKTGAKPGQFMFGDLSVNTGLLHNTHSWIVVARKTVGADAQ
jgi:2-polyprenyl-3-methyl-5-hydroxy-6-metoxy-1,4-benzoquinol methylase